MPRLFYSNNISESNKKKFKTKEKKNYFEDNFNYAKKTSKLIINIFLASK
jgi:hypothetical protein